MHTHIVYCHPSENSLTAEIRDAFTRGLKDSNKTYTMSNLYQQDFITDMSEDEYLRDAFYNKDLPLPPDVLTEHDRINAADAMVFIYPVFWTEAPAKLVGWFDRVWSYGFAYGAAEAQSGLKAEAEAEAESAAEAQSGLKAEAEAQHNSSHEGYVRPMRTLEKALVLAIAGNTKEALREQGRLQSMENVMLDDRIHDRARHKEFVLLGGTERSNAALRKQMREQHLQTAYQMACEL